MMKDSKFKVYPPIIRNILLNIYGMFHSTGRKGDAATLLYEGVFARAFSPRDLAVVDLQYIEITFQCMEQGEMQKPLRGYPVNVQGSLTKAVCHRK